MQYTNVFRPYWISSAACRLRHLLRSPKAKPHKSTMAWQDDDQLAILAAQNYQNSQSTQLHGGRQLHLKPSAGDLHWTTPISWHRELLKNDKVGSLWKIIKKKSSSQHILSNQCSTQMCFDLLGHRQLHVGSDSMNLPGIGPGTLAKKS